MRAALERGKTAVVVARAWGAGAVVAATLAMLVAWRVVPGGAVEVPGREGVRWVVWPLVPFVGTLAVPAGVGAVERALERASPVGRVGPAIGSSCLLVLGAAVGIAGARMAGFDEFAVARNSLLLHGVALATVGVGGTSLAWMPGFAAGVVMWMIGTSPAYVASWAVLFLPGDDPAAWVVAAAAFVGGVAAVGVRYGRCR